jgi:predicted lipoprotein with Yx(FWY)xxD motif
VAESSTAGSAVTVSTATGPLGVYLVDHAGRTLYLFDGDTTEGMSACDGPCAAAWPPLTTTGAPSAGENAAGAGLSTITRSDGSMQVVYGRYPLYYFAGDTAPGQTNGQGSGGTWWVLGTNGEPIRNVAGSSALTSATTN